MLMWRGEWEAAIAQARTALALAPNSVFVISMLGCVLGFGGHHEEALERLRQAMRASPNDPLTWLWTLWTGTIQFYARQFGAAVDTMRELIRRQPGFGQARVILADALGHLGRLDEAREHFAIVRDKIDPRYNPPPWLRPEDYALRLEGRRLALGEPQGLALPDKPSIAVLPFQNMSGDAEQEYFIDGLVEDIITALSRFRQLFVIARNSSFSYKGKAVDVRQIARELGIRYVLEGSIRRAGNRIRVTGQLIDAAGGSHVWAETYDRELQDVFEVQEDLTRSIVAALVPQMESAEFSRHTMARPASLAAHELAYRAFAESIEGYNRSNGPMCDAAIETARKAIALDRNCSQAWAVICFALTQHLLFGRASDIEQVRSEAFAAGTRAIEADPLNHGAFTTRGIFQCNNGRLAAGLQDLQRACALNPNDATALFCLGYFQAMNGDAENGIDSIQKAIRLSPRDVWRPAMHQNLAFACAVGKRYAEGVQAALVACNEAPSMAPGLTMLAVNHVGLGNIPTARAAIDELRKISHEHLDLRLKTGWGCRLPEDAQRLTNFLRTAAGVGEPGAAAAPEPVPG